jgi:lipopolysaccharide transport system permease protein
VPTAYIIAPSYNVARFLPEQARGPHLVGFGVQLLMYATPVIYPASTVPARYRWIVELNPLTPLIEGMRVAFLGAGSLDLYHLGVSFGVMLAMLAVGLMLFTHVERTFMDTV